VLDHKISRSSDPIIGGTSIFEIAVNAGVGYEFRDGCGYATDESNRRVNEWLLHHMDDAPFHKLCYDSSIATKEINAYLHDNGNGSALQIDANYGLTPLHMLTMNPNALAESIASLFNSNMQAVFYLDNQEQTPLDYARKKYWGIGGDGCRSM